LASIRALEAYHRVLTDPLVETDDFEENMFYDEETLSTVDDWVENDSLPDMGEREKIDELYSGRKPPITEILDEVDASPDEVIRYLSENNLDYLNPGQEIK